MPRRGEYLGAVRAVYVLKGAAKEVPISGAPLRMQAEDRNWAPCSYSPTLPGEFFGAELLSQSLLPGFSLGTSCHPIIPVEGPGNFSPIAGGEGSGEGLEGGGPSWLYGAQAGHPFSFFHCPGS